MSTNARVYVEIKGKFAHLFFDQPAARNAMTQEMYEQLRTICLELNQNFQIRAVILRGIGGKSFVSGSDIAQFTAFKDGEDGVRYEKLIDHYLSPLQQLSMPTIAKKRALRTNSLVKTLFLTNAEANALPQI